MNQMFVELNSEQRLYHVVKFYDTQENSLSGHHCVPGPWIKWQDGWTTELLAYPDESREIIRQRVKNYESLDEYWFSSLAEIIYSTDSYDGALQYINEHEKAEKSGSEVIGIENLYHLNSSLRDEGKKGIKVTNPESKVLKSKMDQNIDLDPFLTSAAFSISQVETADNAYNAREKWTLKNPDYSPGLVELLPNTGVFIEESELANCLESSKACYTLARQLTKHIFTESALRKCVSLRTQRSSKNHRLDPNAVETIVNFCRTRRKRYDLRPLTVRAIKEAIRHERINCIRSK